MTAPLRVGVVGAGWAGGLHTVAFNDQPDAQVVALVSRTRQAAQALADRHGIPAVFTDYGEFLDAGLDVVSIATPPASHRAYTVAAAERGLHVLCDKPSAMAGTDAHAMVQAAEAAGVRHATGLIWRGDPAVTRLREMVAAGAIGRVTDVLARCALGAPVLPMTWMYEADAGGGSLMQHGGHVIDRVRWLLGQEFVEVCGETLHDVAEAEVGPRFHNVQEAFGWAARRMADPDRQPLPTAPVTADTGYRLSGVLDGGTRVQMWESWHSQGPVPDTVELYGTSGTLVWSGAGGLLLCRPRRAPERIEVAGSTEAGSRDLKALDAVGRRLWADLVSRFVADIRGTEHAPYPTLADGWRVQAVVDAVRASSRSRSWEKC
jgi:predicted dehydrogenase